MAGAICVFVNLSRSKNISVLTAVRVRQTKKGQKRKDNQQLVYQQQKQHKRTRYFGHLVLTVQVLWGGSR